MKKITITTIALLMTLMLVVAPVKKSNAQFSASISLQTFYDDLDPYGQWVDDPQYGYVWVPEVDRGFRPYYSRGHWVPTRYGNMWVSDYSWGWAPFHYGRWAHSSYYGWIWIPDTEWGPAWVSWRTGSDYYGWAPLEPGISISISFGRNYYSPYDWWTFVPQQYVLSPVFYNYDLAPTNNITYVNNSTIINNTYVNNNVTYAAGPRVNDLERATGRKVQVYDISNDNRPGKTEVQGSVVRAYKPDVSRTGKGNAKPVPPAVISRDQYVKTKGQKSSWLDKPNEQPVRQKAPATAPAEQKQIQNNNVERAKPINQPKQQTERKQVTPPAERKQTEVPNRQPAVKPQQTERKQVNPPAERKQVQMPARQPETKPQQQQVERKQVSPPAERKQVEIPPNRMPPQPMERKQTAPQPERKQVQQQNQPQNKPQQQPQQQQQQPKQQSSGNKGNGKGKN